MASSLKCSLNELGLKYVGIQHRLKCDGEWENHGLEKLLIYNLEMNCRRKHNNQVKVLSELVKWKGG